MQTAHFGQGDAPLAFQEEAELSPPSFSCCTARAGTTSAVLKFKYPKMDFRNKL